MADSPKVPLGDKPGTNWVERTGALKPHATNWIYRVAEHLKGKGYPDGHAIAIAVNAAKYLCHSGDVKLPGKQDVNPGSRAEACAALAKWNSARARAKATNLTAYEQFKAIDLTAHWIGRIIDLTVESEPSGVIDLAFNPDEPRDELGKWRRLVGKLEDLKVGDTHKVSRSFSVTKLKQTGVRKYRVTMKGASHGRAAGDQHIYEDTVVDAADAALGISPSEAAHQVRAIRAGRAEPRRP